MIFSFQIIISNILKASFPFVIIGEHINKPELLQATGLITIYT